MKKIKSKSIFLAVWFAIIFGAATVFPQTTEFSYQGFFTDNNASANGNFDFEFRLFDSQNGGIALATNARANVSVTNGIFSVTLDFGAFPAANRFLEIGVRPSGGGAFTTLAPRSKILSTPFSTNATNATNAVNSNNSNNASTAQNALQLGGVNASQFVQTNDARLSDSRNPLPNSPNYVQNRTTQQTSTNFNISGDGTIGGTLTGNIVSASTQFNLGANRVLAKVGANNLFLGTLAGRDNGGIQNTLIGDSAGKTNTGNENTMLGFVAGQDSTSGGFNTFIGSRTGLANLTGSNNTFLGYKSDGGANNLINATAIGSNAFVESNNSLVLGSISGKNGATVDAKVGIGITSPDATLDIEGQLPNNLPNTPNLRLTNFGRFSLIRGRSASGSRSTPTATTNGSSLLVITGDGYTGSAFTNLGMATIQFAAAENWTSTANGTSIVFSTTQIGTNSEIPQMSIGDNGNVSIGRFAPIAAQKLDVSGNVRIGTGTNGCIEDRDGTVIAGVCSSDLRFKKDVKSFGNVLSNFSRLRPVNYFWRADEFKDKNFGTRQSYGWIAQEVEEIFPELVSTDEQGYKMVNYSKLPLLTVQAVKELKSENDLLKQKISDQQKAIDDLKNLVKSIQTKIETNDKTFEKQKPEKNEEEK